MLKKGGGPLNAEQVLNIASGVVACLSASAFAVQIQVMKLKVNLATWGMILLLDVIGIILVILSGNKEPFIQFGWVIAATLIFIAAWINRGDWKWGRTETYATCCCFVSVAWWILAWGLQYNPAWSITGYVVACFVSVWPQAKQYWTDHKEARKTAWLWITSSFALVLAILSIPSFSPEYSIYPIGILLLNLIMVWITLRKPKQ